MRSALDCFLVGAAFGSGSAPGLELSLTFYAVGQPEPNLARLSTNDGRGDLLFRFVHFYTVVHAPDARRGPFSISTSFYQYRVLDWAENEIVVYEWVPAGISPVRTPHMHVPMTRSHILKQRTGSPIAYQKTHLGKVHFPTGGIVIEDVAELLIREFGVDPLRDDWQDTLKANRAWPVRA